MPRDVPVYFDTRMAIQWRNAQMLLFSRQSCKPKVVFTSSGYLFKKYCKSMKHKNRSDKLKNVCQIEYDHIDHTITSSRNRPIVHITLSYTLPTLSDVIWDLVHVNLF